MIQTVHPDVSEFYDRLLFGCPKSHAQLQAMTTRAKQGASRPGETDVIDQLRALHTNEEGVVISGDSSDPSPRYPAVPPSQKAIDPRLMARILQNIQRAKGSHIMHGFGPIGARGGGGMGGGGFRGGGSVRPGGGMMPRPMPRPMPHPGGGGMHHPGGGFPRHRGGRFFGGGGGWGYPWWGGYGYGGNCQWMMDTTTGQYVRVCWAFDPTTGTYRWMPV